MAVDYFASCATILSSTIAASVGAFLSARFGGRQRSQAEEQKRRRSAADSIAERLLALRALLRDAQFLRDVPTWRDAIEGAYEAFDDAHYRLPSGFRHVKRSVRAAIGEATGLSFTDSWPRSQNDADDLADFSNEWTTNAADYLDAVVDAIRAWRDAGHHAAERIDVPSFDAWLAATGRYVPGGIPAGDPRKSARHD